jgi:hypothetical protein
MDADDISQAFYLMPPTPRGLGTHDLLNRRVVGTPKFREEAYLAQLVEDHPPS